VGGGKMTWRNINNEKPKDGQHILARFKHGIIDCRWEESSEVGCTYIWHDLEFYVYEWMPIEEFELTAKQQTATNKGERE
jgi:hypothetical protein